MMQFPFATNERQLLNLERTPESQLLFLRSDFSKLQYCTPNSTDYHRYIHNCSHVMVVHTPKTLTLRLKL